MRKELPDLSRFQVGTRKHHRSWLGDFLTDGAKFIQDEMECNWLTDLISIQIQKINVLKKSYCYDGIEHRPMFIVDLVVFDDSLPNEALTSDKIAPEMIQEWKRRAGYMGEVIFQDGNRNEFYRMPLEITTFPAPGITMWAIWEPKLNYYIIMLPIEY